MSNNKISRRTFIRNASLGAAGTLAGALLAEGCRQSKTVDTSKILNYNPKMGYRRLGGTGLVISEVSLGGHWKDRDGSRYCANFANDEVPADMAKNRIEVISACIDAGINYVDISTSAECLAYGVALKGRRDKMLIGADDFQLCARKAENCRVDKLMFDIEQCCRRLKTDYLDIWRIKADMYGGSTDSQVEIMVETFQKARSQGKVRHLAISSHRRSWLQHVIETFPEVGIVSFPCSAKTRELGRRPMKDNIEEVNAGYGADIEQSIFHSVRERDIGVVAINPFLGGKLFERKTKFPVVGPGTEKENRLARLTLQCILTNDAITATIPGLTTVYEVNNAVTASYTRKAGQTVAEKAWLNCVTDRRWELLRAEYAWLRDWEVV